MSKEKLENYVLETISFDTIDEAFEDYIYGAGDEDISENLVNEISEKEKKRILSLSPSYIYKNGKYYFNGDFQDLGEKEINKIINEYEKEEI